VVNIKATAVCHPNLALIKYWGKRDTVLNLPAVSSISISLDNLKTVTSVEFSSEYKEDIFFLNNQKKQDKRVFSHIQKIRQLSGKTDFACIRTENNFPTSAGLASSSSGFAALTIAACKALGLELSTKELSILARHGSGSAARSIEDGFVVWHKGEREDGLDSYGELLYPKDYWPELKILVVIVEDKQKETSSRDGMDISRRTSYLYNEWVNQNSNDIQQLLHALQQKDFTMLGKLAEDNCLRMHKVMQTSTPSLNYWNKQTVEVMDKVRELRKAGIECYFTIDAGANVFILFEAKSKGKIEDKFQNYAIKCCL